MRPVAIIQARMKSTRLPGKVLADLEGQPMLLRVLDRLRKARTLATIVVATTTEPDDDPVADLCGMLSVPIFRGSEKDVLSRYAGAARHFEADVVVRVTADCPLIDPEIVDLVVEQLLESGTDYASNTISRTYPRGLDVEAFRREALEQAAQEAGETWERAHVTPYIYRHSNLFTLCSVDHDRDLSRHRWTVDTPEDLEFVRAIYSRIEDPALGWLGILELVEKRPGLKSLNAAVEQKTLEEG